MGEFKGTPWPWRVVCDHRTSGNAHRGFPGSQKLVRRLISGPAGVPVISRNGLARPAKPDGEANARLIAAAPALLEALGNLVSLADFEGFSGHTDVHAARAAIASALGEG